MLKLRPWVCWGKLKVLTTKNDGNELRVEARQGLKQRRFFEPHGFLTLLSLNRLKVLTNLVGTVPKDVCEKICTVSGRFYFIKGKEKLYILINCCHKNLFTVHNNLNNTIHFKLY